MGITLFWSEKPTQSDQSSIKIWVKIFWSFFHLQNSPPPPMQIPGYAPGLIKTESGYKYYKTLLNTVPPIVT